MMMSNNSSWLSFLFIVILSSISSFSFTTPVEAQVPKSKTFKYVNKEVTETSVSPALEFGGSYRPLDHISNKPFGLSFYNPTSDSSTYTLALGIGNASTPWAIHIVWAANWNNRVRDGATLTFRKDGNLILADVDGRVAWQTYTANKGVVDLKLLSNGNLVLLDRLGGFVWQSFHYPTDTLLVGQSLVPGAKLKSRPLISSDNSHDDGPYSMVLERTQFALYYNSNKSSKPMRYYAYSFESDESVREKGLKNLTFSHLSPETDAPHKANVLRFEYFTDVLMSAFNTDIVETKYNSTFSFLRLDWDGNLRVYTYYDDYDISYTPWETTHTQLPVDAQRSECQLPNKCGSFGLCQNSFCIGCPTPTGVTQPWTKTCQPPKLPSCGSGRGSTANGTQIGYYKMVSVDHFTSYFTGGEGPMKESECEKKCTEDCKCVAFFYRSDASTCILTTELNTLTLVYDDWNGLDSTHLAFIKYQK